MFKQGDAVRLDAITGPLAINGPLVNEILGRDMSTEEVYLIEEVETDLVPADEETGQREYEHTAIRLRGHAPDRWFDASWFVPA